MATQTPTQDGTQSNTADGTAGTGNGKSAETPTLTTTQAEKMVNDALADKGRDAKTLSDGQAALTADRSTHDALVLSFQERQDAAEDATHKDNPDGLRTLQTQRTLERRESDLKRKETEFGTRITELETREKTAAASQHGTIAAKIAQELGVPIEPLLNFTDGTEEGMKTLAASLTKTGAGNANGDTPAPDSGVNLGGVAVDTNNIDALHLEGKVSDADYRTFLRTNQLPTGATGG